MNLENDISSSLKILSEGGLILYPTDTIWGIGCDATNKEAVEKIYSLKKREDQKAMIILVADKNEIQKYAAEPDLRLFDFLNQAEKPITVVYENAIGLAENLVSEDRSIAIRICNEPFCTELLKRYRKPIVSTSANISSHPAPGNFSEIDQEIKDGVDYIVKYRQEDQTIRLPSSLIRWKNGRPEYLRN